MDEDQIAREFLKYRRNKLEFLEAIDSPSAVKKSPPANSELARLLAANNLQEKYLDQDLLSTPVLEALGFSSDGRVGDFQLIKLIGRGGMGVVYLAEYAASGDQVAVKFLRPSLLTDHFREKFDREIEILRQMDHPWIARFISAGTIPSILGDVPFIAQEYVRGMNIDSYMEAQNMDLHARIGIVLKICQVLDYAHGLGVIHCDLKPANILITENGTPRVLDFGISIFAPTEYPDPADEETLLLLGTMSYMSPEQLHKGFGKVEPRSDIFSLGVILFHFLTGELPFDGHSPAQVLGSILLDAPGKVSSISPDLSPHLDLIVAGCLAKNPADRYRSMGDLARDLQRYLDGLRPRGAVSQSWLSRINFKLAGGVVFLLILLLSVGFGKSQWDDNRLNASLERLGSQLEAADVGIHFGPRSEGSLNESLEHLRLATWELPHIRGHQYDQAVERYIHWREGEAHYFLGGILDSPEQFRSAMIFFSLAYGGDDNSYSVEDLPLSKHLVKRIAYLQPYHFAGGQALAHAALAVYEDPRFNLKRAVDFRRAAIESWAHQQDPEVGIFDQVDPRPFLFHDLGRALVDQGYYLASPKLIREGLRYLEHVETEKYWPQGDRSARVAYIKSVIWANAALGELVSDSRLCFKAEQIILGTLGVVGSPADGSQANTRLLLAQVALICSRLPGVDVAAQLDLGRQAANQALAYFLEAGQRPEAARARLVLARIELTAQKFGAVTEILASLAGDPGLSQRPLMQTDLTLIRAELAKSTCEHVPNALSSLKTFNLEMETQQTTRLTLRAKNVREGLVECLAEQSR